MVFSFSRQLSCSFRRLPYPDHPPNGHCLQIFTKAFVLFVVTHCSWFLSLFFSHSYKPPVWKALISLSSIWASTIKMMSWLSMSQLLYQDLLRTLPHLKTEMCPAPNPRIHQSLQRLFDTEGGQFTEEKQVVVDASLLMAGNYCLFKAISVDRTVLEIWDLCFLVGCQCYASLLIRTRLWEFSVHFYLRGNMPS